MKIRTEGQPAVGEQERKKAGEVIRSREAEKMTPKEQQEQEDNIAELQAEAEEAKILDISNVDEAMEIVKLQSGEVDPNVATALKELNVDIDEYIDAKTESSQLDDRIADSQIQLKQLQSGFLSKLFNGAKIRNINAKLEAYGTQKQNADVLIGQVEGYAETRGTQLDEEIADGFDASDNVASNKDVIASQRSRQKKMESDAKRIGR